MIGLAQIGAFGTLAGKNLKQGNIMSDDTPTLPHPYAYRAASVETMLQAVTDLTSKWPQSYRELDAQVATYPNITCVPGGDHPQSIGLSLTSLEGGDAAGRDDLYDGEYYMVPTNAYDVYEAALDAQFGEGTEIERDDDMAHIEWYLDNGARVTLSMLTWDITLMLEASGTWESMEDLERRYHSDIDLYDPRRQTPPSGYY
jgi:hypothetical protein